MSARPRPVTATICHQPSDVVTGVRTRSYSLSSGSSTASLVSILDHDSYESPMPSDDEAEHVHENKDANRNKQDINFHSNGSHISTVVRNNGNNDNSRDHSYSEQITETSETVSKSERAEPTLSPWEKWLVRKTKQELKIQEEETRKRQKQLEEEERKRREKQQQCKNGAVKIQQWIEVKKVQTKVRKEQEAKRLQTAKELEEQKKQDIEEKAKQKYAEWIESKKKEEKTKAQQEKDKKEEEQRKKEERKQRSEQAFKEWKKSTKDRPVSAHSSYGYTCGKLTGYHDQGAVYPTPSFYNPNPWKPIHVPQPKSERPKSRNKSCNGRRWNPNKYI